VVKNSFFSPADEMNIIAADIIAAAAAARACACCAWEQQDPSMPILGSGFLGSWDNRHPSTVCSYSRALRSYVLYCTLVNIYLQTNRPLANFNGIWGTCSAFSKRELPPRENQQQPQPAAAAGGRSMATHPAGVVEFNQERCAGSHLGQHHLTLQDASIITDCFISSCGYYILRTLTK